MAIHVSPLRYPGGKASMSEVLANLLVANDLHDGTFVEPFAGGAGAALTLMVLEYADDIVLNDADPAIATFWRVLLKRTDELVRLVEETPVTLETWQRCRSTYLADGDAASDLDLAFAVFFLNRCNRSGIICNGGPIGGHDQRGKWKLDARYNVDGLVSRIERVAAHRDLISVHNLDAVELLTGDHFDTDHALVFLDPPYYEKGQGLYLNSMQHDDHAQLAELLLSEPEFHWVLTYDDVPEIRELYSDTALRCFTLRYSANRRRQGRELIVVDPRLEVPETVFDIPRSPTRISFA